MIKKAIHYPITCAVAVIFLVLFGIIALFRVPIQLIPAVQEPQITVTTVWPGANPQEVEREITDEQEEQLKSLTGLLKMESTSQESRSQITLTFQVGIDLDTTLIRVSNRLEQVPNYPTTALKPVLDTANANNMPVAWFVLIPYGETPFKGDMSTNFALLDNLVKPELERIPGVAAINVFGGRDNEIHVSFDPVKLADRGISVSELGQALARENDNYSGGDFSEGKRRYAVRVTGQYKSTQDVEKVVIAMRKGAPVRIGDVASVTLGWTKVAAKVMNQGRHVIAMNCVRETDSNVLEVVEGLEERMAVLNKEILEPRGLHFYLAYNQTDYIYSAINLVRQSLILGGFLAIFVLLAFLRSGSSTLIIAIAIPISIVGSFLVMNLFGRSINVISLAGMAFAVGMVVDNSIVALENIFRHRQLGSPPMKAALDGAKEVWGAILASTLTTIAVFLPILFVEEEAGQLFRDIALAISCAVFLSLLVSVTVIPTLSARFMRPPKEKKGSASVGVKMRDGLAGLSSWCCANSFRQLLVVIVLTGGAIGLSMFIFPKTDYLPEGNQNLLFGRVFPPPGYNIEQMASIGKIYEEELEHLYKADPADPETKKLPAGGLREFFFVATRDMAFMGGSGNEPERLREVLPEFARANTKIPGSFAVTIQASVFSTSFGSGRSIDVEISGPELQQLLSLGGQVMARTREKLAGAQAQPSPPLDLGNPELQLNPDRRRLSELGMSNQELGFTVSALVDGIKVSEYVHEGREIDIILKSEEGHAHSTHRLNQMPVATSAGDLVTLGSLADFQLTTGPAQIYRVDRQRAVVIRVVPASSMPLETAMDLINNEVLAPMRDEGIISDLYRTRLSGSADKLTQTANALKWNLLLAVLITYLLLSALFESFLYPFVILFSVPLAGLGGFLGLKTVGFETMDVLTMLGFIILIGTVVNNAILIVHQSLLHLRDHSMDVQTAINEATKTRIRPIFMSVSTSVLGMLPLVLFPGAGSELYRGLGSVVVGGLIISTIFTLFLVPALLSICLNLRIKLLGSENL